MLFVILVQFCATYAVFASLYVAVFVVALVKGAASVYAGGGLTVNKMLRAGWGGHNV